MSENFDHQAWRDIGLSPLGGDERVIKIAYAKRLRSVRPDNDPDGFERLQAARDFALARTRYVDVATRLNFADHAGKVWPLLTDPAAPLSQRVAELAFDRTQAGRDVNWEHVSDAVSGLDLAARADLADDLQETLLRSLGYYTDPDAFQYPRRMAGAFEPTTRRAVVDLLDDAAFRGLPPDSTPERWLLCALGLSDAPYRPPSRHRKGSFAYLRERFNGSVSQNAALQTLVIAVLAGEGIFAFTGLARLASTFATTP